MNANNLFKKFRNSNQIKKALLVGRNMVNRNPSNDKYLDDYLELLLFLAEKLPNLDERKSFIAQANITLSFYEENAYLSEEIINKIENYRNKLESIAIEIDNVELGNRNNILENIKDKNNIKIKSLFSIKQNILDAKCENDFNKLMLELNNIDSQIEHEYLTDSQKSYYDSFSKEFTELISSKMREFEYKNNIKYNEKAINAYNEAFNKFKNNESLYKNKTELFKLVESTLFAYDASRLFNETLIYYNHIYSYIFSKLDDEGKFALTKYSIECERK